MLCAVEQENEELKKRIEILESVIREQREQIREMLANSKED